VGAENTDTSCDLHVLVYETAESISLLTANLREDGRVTVG
jgi:hypothetical protein